VQFGQSGRQLTVTGPEGHRPSPHGDHPGRQPLPRRLEGGAVELLLLLDGYAVIFLLLNGLEREREAQDLLLLDGEGGTLDL